MKLQVLGSLFLLLAPAVGQAIWIVDRAGGPGVHFTEIQPAVLAAAPGDFIHVAAALGSYAGFTVSRPVTLIGGFGPVNAQTHVAGNVSITGIQAGDVCMIAGLSVGFAAGSGLTVTANAGLVHLEAISSWFCDVSFVDCSNVVLRQCSFAIGYNSSTCSMLRSQVAAIDCNFTSDYPSYASALDVSQSILSMQRFYARGANGGFGVPTPGVREFGSSLFCGPNTRLQGGHAVLPFGGSYSASGLVTNGGSLAGDPRAYISGGRTPMPQYRVDETNIERVRAGRTSSVDVNGPDAGVALVALSDVLPAPISLGPLGDLWLDQASLLILGLVPLDAMGRGQTTFAAPSQSDLGRRHVAQSLVLGPSGEVKLTLPSPFTILP
ncbi:MAG: hypothetical protein MUC36_16295 [Planctomycetes bacterium]|nr:hypothetical protein [Planctomycetota bacterium]